MPESTPLRDLFAQYEVKRLRGKSAGTAARFYTAIAAFEEFLKRAATSDDLFDDRVNSFQWWLISARGIVNETAVGYIKKLLALWRFANRHRLCDTWPEIQLLTVPKREPVAWTEPEVKILFRALCQQEGNIGSQPAGIFWPALQLTFWESAERLGAVLMLQTADVNLKAGWAICRAENRKGRLADRGFSLRPQTVSVLSRFVELNPKRRLLFECPFGEQTLRDRYKSILRDAGLPHDRNRLFHCLRRTVASHFEALGHDAMELLGHTSREVTKRYLAPQIVRHVQPADVLFWPGE